MNKYLQDLIKLSKFDTAISMFEPKIENEKAKLATFVETAESIKASINSIYLEIDDVKSKRTKNNIHLAELKTKLDNIAKKNKDVHNDKELKALQLEEEIAKEQISFANEEIDRLDNLTKNKETILKELQEKLTAEEDDIKEIQVAVDSTIEEINKVFAPFFFANKKSKYQSSASITTKTFCLFTQKGKNISNGKYLTFGEIFFASSNPVFVITEIFASFR